jgi:hypothetical protein
MAQANQQPALPPVVFALFPGRVAQLPLDFSNTADVKLYHKAIETLKVPYDLSPIRLHEFLCGVRERATAYGWEDIITLPDSSVPPVNRNILSEYGLITMDDCRRASTAYFNAQTRQAQNSIMMYMFLSNSLTADARTLVFAFSREFTLNTPLPIDMQLGSGILLLKTIIGKAVVDSEATVDTIRNSIATLDLKMSDLQSNIMQFNMHVMNQKNGLEARGEAVPELMTNLFRAYLAASDNDFVDYIKAKKFAHIDRTAPETPESLMAKALAHYEAAVERKMWNAPNVKDAKIIALTAENASLKGKKAKDATSAGRRSKNQGKWAWKDVKPVAGETTKVFNSKTYHWCKWHKAWTEHNPVDCTLQHKQENKAKAPETVAPHMSLDPAFQALVECDSD